MTSKKRDITTLDITDASIAATQLFDKLEATRTDAATLYRTHLQSLIQHDYIQMNVTLGDFNFTYSGKKDTLNAVSVLVLQLIQKFIESEPPYKSDDGKEKNPAYG